MNNQVYKLYMLYHSHYVNKIHNILYFFILLIVVEIDNAAARTCGYVKNVGNHSSGTVIRTGLIVLLDVQPVLQMVLICC